MKPIALVINPQIREGRIFPRVLLRWVGVVEYCIIPTDQMTHIESASFYFFSAGCWFRLKKLYLKISRKTKEGKKDQETNGP